MACLSRGYSNYFWWGMRSEPGLKPLSTSKDFSHSKKLLILCFLFLFFCVLFCFNFSKSGPISTSKTADFTIFLISWIDTLSSKDYFLTKLAPMIFFFFFCGKQTHLDGTFPYTLTCESPHISATPNRLYPWQPEAHLLICYKKKCQTDKCTKNSILYLKFKKKNILRKMWTFVLDISTFQLNYLKVLNNQIKCSGSDLIVESTLYYFLFFVFSTVSYLHLQEHISAFPQCISPRGVTFN